MRFILALFIGAVSSVSCPATAFVGDVKHNSPFDIFCRREEMNETTKMSSRLLPCFYVLSYLSPPDIDVVKKCDQILLPAFIFA